jgi:methylene-fatty-acyl-phospholipid synthase
MSSTNFLDYVDYTKPSFLHALGCIVIAPIIWNIIARLEFYTRFLTKITTSPYVGCYLLALWIFSFSLYRDFMYVFDLTAPPPCRFRCELTFTLRGPNFVSR